MSFQLRALRAFRPVRSSTFARPISTTPALRFPRKDTQDKDSLSPNPTEYSKSGGDQSTAQTDTAFDPSNTSPEGQEAQAAQESGGAHNSPLDGSPANHEISKPNDEKLGGAERSPNESAGGRKQSGGGSPMKSGTDGKHGGGGAGGNA